MKHSRKVFFLSTVYALAFGICLSISSALINAQDRPLTYPAVMIALGSKVPNKSYKNTNEVINHLIVRIKQLRIDKPLTQDREDDLRQAGATDLLIAVIRENSPPLPKPLESTKPAPIPTPTPPDSSFFLKRADVSFEKGDFAVALVDYDKALELKTDDAAAFFKRGKAYHNLNSFEKALADYDKSIDLNPKGSMTYYNRGVAYEKMGEVQKAMADYQKALDLDTGNEIAKSSFKKLQNEVGKADVKVPESISIGSLSKSKATVWVDPVYPEMARKLNIAGEVRVEVKLDEKGNVVSAKAINGHPFLRRAAEDAARKCKFRPALFNAQPIKGVGMIIYNFIR